MRWVKSEAELLGKQETKDQEHCRASYMHDLASFFDMCEHMYPAI